MKLWDQIKNLFAETETSSPSEPVVHETLRRHREVGEEYVRWREGLVARRLLSYLADQYATFLTEPARLDEALDFLDLPSSKGFVIHFDRTQYTLREAEFFQLLLRERVKALPYRTQVADTRTYLRGKYVERTDRYYLKPRPRWSDPRTAAGDPDHYAAGQFEQQFGNILIELIVRNDQPHHLRFSATTYQDRVYTKAEGFGGLMSAVLG